MAAAGARTVDEQTQNIPLSRWRGHLALALVSGGPALVYQVVWTRQVALVIGSHLEAISTVLVAFFGGLAIGSRVFGGLADRVRSPLRLYGVLEIIAGAIALASPLAVSLVERQLAGRAAPVYAMVAIGSVMLAVTFLLGGTLPALVKSSLRGPRVGSRDSARASGWLVGVNTAGAVIGVAIAAALVPLVGLRVTLLAAGSTAIVIGIVAVALGGAGGEPRPQAPDSTPEPPRPPLPIMPLLVAAVGGVATLSFEVLAARCASLWLGSSLYAWAIVLGLFLIGLASGNVLAARRVALSVSPARSLAIIELVAAGLLASAIAWAVPDPARPATGLSREALTATVLWILPVTVLMGAAFPFFVRLGVREGRTVGAAFGAVSAANTGGGIVGAMLAPFVLLPIFGLAGGLRACAVINGLLAVGLLLGDPDAVPLRLRRAALATVVLVAAGAIGVLTPRTRPPSVRLLHVSHGRQATAAVVHQAGRRDLIVDGDPEASTGADARVTEELLAILAITLHPSPERFLEIGFGSGITFGTASRFPLEQLECVEISRAVLDCAPFFEPDNHGVASGDDPRITISRLDGRAYLLTQEAQYDVIVANTLHPWSVGATGLYSSEYFGRIRRALRPGGVAAQWLPIARLGRDNLASILRTFFSTFPEGELWWGAGNVIVVGYASDVGPGDGTRLPREPRYDEAARMLTRLGIRTREDLLARRLAPADLVLEEIGPGLVLTDDLPRLEISGSFRRARGQQDGGELALIAAIAQRSATRWPGVRPISGWLASGVARLGGDESQATELETEAIDAGLSLARQSRARRSVLGGLAALGRGELEIAERSFARALDAYPDQPQARFGMAVIAAQRQDPESAEWEARQLLLLRPDYAEAWTLLAQVRAATGDQEGARVALDRALESDPFHPDTLRTATRIAIDAGDLTRARELLDRIDSLADGPQWPGTSELRAALAAREE
jgi:spermidine synthase/Flp pilus assembly protein TadD